MKNRVAVDSSAVCKECGIGQLSVAAALVLMRVLYGSIGQYTCMSNRTCHLSLCMQQDTVLLKYAIGICGQLR